MKKYCKDCGSIMFGVLCSNYCFMLNNSEKEKDVFANPEELEEIK